MRLLLCLLFLIGFGPPATAQTAGPISSLARHDYLLKSYSQRRAANVMLVMGSSVALTAAIGIASSLQNRRVNPSSLVWEQLMVAGMGVAVVSVPLYVAAQHNRRQAAIAHSLQLEAHPVVPVATGRRGTFPAVGLRLRF
ncbi:hypothetical protein [Hymenobacter sp. B1770]|uniref:hypothetical protein n=1 Tax=Hymenobacter sp. B1770 TaxID=1718788 RepID=UPI003CF77356